MSVRRSIFENLPALNVSDFKPKQAPDPTAPRPEEIRSVAERAAFRSREPQPQSIAQYPRRRRPKSGRTAQFNCKVSPQILEKFYSLAEMNDLLYCEAFERALDALERELSKL